MEQGLTYTIMMKVRLTLRVFYKVITAICDDFYDNSLGKGCLMQYFRLIFHTVNVTWPP